MIKTNNLRWRRWLWASVGGLLVFLTCNIHERQEPDSAMCMCDDR